MSQKNETLLLSLTLLVTISVIFGGLWLLMGRWKDINSPNNSSSNSSSSPVATNNTNHNNQQSNIINYNNGCPITNMPQGTFSYGGSTTWATIRKDVDSVLKNLCPQFNLRYTQPINEKPGSGTGIKMLIANQLAFSQSSRSLKPEENTQAQQKGFSLKEIPVAIDGIAIAVNPKLNIPGLTVAQIKDIYTGKITNWQQVGGENLAIVPISRNKESGGTVDFFVENILNKENFGNNIIYIGTTTEAIRKTAITPGSIYYGSAPEIVPQCTIRSLPVGRKSDQFIAPYQQPYIPPSQCNPTNHNKLNIQDFQNGNYPITRNLFVIVKQNNQIDQQAGESYANWLLTSQGQDLIETTGFVKIK